MGTEYTKPVMAEEEGQGRQAVIVLHAFDNREISLIMKAVKRELSGRDIIFAKSTPTSLKMRLGELVEDVNEDHQYIKQNPPQKK